MARRGGLSIRFAVRLFGVLAALGVGYGAVKVDVKNMALRTVTGPGSISRIIAILLVLANLKVLPFVWHLRVFGAVLKHMELSPRKRIPYGPGIPLLFQPIISRTQNPIMECDWNIHKSNGTYFTDLDVTRTNLSCCLFRDGIRQLEFHPESVIGPDGMPAKGRWGFMLGAVHCSFKKEIRPYETYEMWSRVLCWDRKWIYMVSHFVKKGAVVPTGYTLNAPGSSVLGSFFGKTGKAHTGTKGIKSVTTTETTSSFPVDPAIPNGAIFASAISKYVTKLGRLTIHPEVLLVASGLLPPKPGGWKTMSGPGPQSNGHTVSPKDTMNGSADTTNNIELAISNGNNDDFWDWKRVEAENARGMQYAEHFAALDGLHQEFSGEDGPALGVYRDIL